MRKLIASLLLSVMVSPAFCACEETGTVYVACKPGYYLESYDCKRCPSSGGVYGTTSDNNKGGITSCYIPTDKLSAEDNSGYFTCGADTYYVKPSQ